ncbi:MAG TPA: hypothetical protein ENN11_01960 [Methanomicrobia archaeon]|nr:hypothetical protein [Methanomicrobia archaeon]
MSDDVKRLIDDIRSPDARMKFGAAKEIRRLSAEAPHSVYPYFDVLVSLLDGGNTILKWNAILAIGDLSAVDDQGKVDPLVEKFITYLGEGSMITANNTIVALTTIARNDLRHRARIIDALCAVESHEYDTEECRGIVIGKAILALDELRDHLRGDTLVIDFLRRHTSSVRPTTARNAQRLLDVLADR